MESQARHSQWAFTAFFYERKNGTIITGKGQTPQYHVLYSLSKMCDGLMRIYDTILTLSVSKIIYVKELIQLFTFGYNQDTGEAKHIRGPGVLKIKYGSLKASMCHIPHINYLSRFPRFPFSSSVNANTYNTKHIIEMHPIKGT